MCSVMSPEHRCEDDRTSNTHLFSPPKAYITAQIDEISIDLQNSQLLAGPFLHRTTYDSAFKSRCKKGCSVKIPPPPLNPEHSICHCFKSWLSDAFAQDEDYTLSIMKEVCACMCVRKHRPRGCGCNLGAHSLMPRCRPSLTWHYGSPVSSLPAVTSQRSSVGGREMKETTVTCANASDVMFQFHEMTRCTVSKGQLGHFNLSDADTLDSLDDFLLVFCAQLPPVHK